MATTVRLLSDYILSGVPYKSGDLVSIDSTLATALAAGGIVDNNSAAIVQANIEQEIVNFPAIDGVKNNLSKLLNKKKRLKIATIGDSRANYGYRPMWKSAVIHSAGSYNGLPIYLRGCGFAITSDDVTGATCMLEYRASDGALRWTAPGDTAGPWTLFGKTTIWNKIQSGTVDKWLYFGIHRNTAWPATDVTLSVDVSGSMLYGKEARGYFPWLTAKLKKRHADIEYLAVANQTTTGLFNSIAAHNEGVTGGIDLIRIGTNDITVATDAVLAESILETMKANMRAYIESRFANNRFVILLGETARLKSGTIASSPVALDSWQLKMLLDYNFWLEQFAANNYETCRYVDLYTSTVDGTAIDGRPTARALIDHVHDSILGAIDIANKIVTQLQPEILHKGQSYPVGNPLALMGTNYSLQATSAAGLGTGASGVTPTTITSTLAQAAGTCTVVGSAVARVDDVGGNWFRMVCAATANSSIVQWRTISKTLATLGKFVGDTIRFEVELSVVNGTLVNYIDVFMLFTGAAGSAGVYLMSKHTVTTPDESSVSFSGIFEAPPAIIPVGTTAIQCYVYVGLQNGGSAQVDIANIIIE